MILDSNRITIREVADDVDTSFGSCQAIYTDSKIAKQSRIDIAQEMLTTFNDDLDLLKKTITGDGSWV